MSNEAKLPNGDKMVKVLCKQYPHIPKSVFFTMPAADRKALYKDPSILDVVVERARSIRREYDNKGKKVKRKYVRRNTGTSTIPFVTPNTSALVTPSAPLNTLTKSLLLIQIASVLENMSVNDALQVLPMMQQISLSNLSNRR